MSKFLYTIVCRHYTINGIIELDLYEELRRLHIRPAQGDYTDIYGYNGLVRYHVYSGQAVEYVIKRVLRDIDITEETRRFYSYYPPYSLMYDCNYDLKDVNRMNREKIDIRLRMTDAEFQKVFGGKI